MKLLRRRGPMTCREVGRLLQHYLDGALDGDRAARLTAHLEECRRCGLDAATYLRIRTALAERGTGELPAASLERLVAFGERLAHEHGFPDTA